MQICKCPVSGWCNTNKTQTRDNLHKKCQNNFATFAAVSQAIPRTVTPTTSQWRATPREFVGAALKYCIDELFKIRSRTGCGCTDLAKHMDGWGISGGELRQQNIVDALVANRELLTHTLAESAFDVAKPMTLNEIVTGSKGSRKVWWKGRDVTTAHLPNVNVTTLRHSRPDIIWNGRHDTEPPRTDPVRRIR